MLNSSEEGTGLQLQHKNNYSFIIMQMHNVISESCCMHDFLPCSREPYFIKIWYITGGVTAISGLFIKFVDK